MKMRTILIVALMALGACATVEGAGQDISAGARAVGNLFQ